MMAPSLSGTAVAERRFAHLGDTVGFGPVRMRFERADVVAPEDLPLVTNVRVVAFVGDLAIVIRTLSGYGIPGGTCEPGEDWQATARRELAEEIGARVGTLVPFGLLRGRSDAADPYRPHLAHPDLVQVVAFADVTALNRPCGEADDPEGIVAVECVPLREAVERFAAEPLFGDLYCLAADLHAHHCR